jgi:hypothetical protein
MYQRLSDLQVGISPGLLTAFVLQINLSFGIMHIFCRTNSDNTTG